jgi:transcriptional regulator with XRE-family HTH domain
MFARREAIAISSIEYSSLNLNSMSRSELIKLRIREFAAKEGWTLKELSERSGVSYSTIKTYAVSEGMVMADLAALRKLAQTFDVLIEDLLEVVQE